MIDLTQYRVRIGTFNPRISSKGKFTLSQHTRFEKNKSSSVGKVFFQVCLSTMKIILLTTFLVLASEPKNQSEEDLAFSKTKYSSVHCPGQSYNMSVQNQWLLGHSLPVPLHWLSNNISSAITQWLLCPSLLVLRRWLLCPSSSVPSRWLPCPGSSVPSSLVPTKWLLYPSSSDHSRWLPCPDSSVPSSLVPRKWLLCPSLPDPSKWLPCPCSSVTSSPRWLIWKISPVPAQWLPFHSSSVQDQQLLLWCQIILVYISSGLLATLPCPIDWNFLARYTHGNRRHHGIRILHWNKGPSHLENKKNEIQAIVNKYHPHILGLSEANFHSYHDRDKVQLPDYTLHTCPTLDNPELKVSRVVVYTHSSLVVKLRPDLMDHSISSIWMEIGLPGRSKILVCNTYREWQYLGQKDSSSRTVAAQLTRWELFLQQWDLAIREDKEVIVTGDINIDSFKWCRDDLPSTDSTYKLRPLIELLFERIIPQGFSQQVCAATHSWAGQHPSCIDHLYTNKPEKITEVQAHINGGSDHKLISVVRYAKAIKRNVRYIRKRCFKGFDEEKFKEEVKNLHWYDVYSESNVDIAVAILTDKISVVLDKYAPVKTIQVRPNYAPWLNNQVKEVLRQRDIAQLVAAQSQCQDNWRHYKNLRNNATKCMKEAKKVWESDQLSYFGNNATNLWRNLKSWMRWKNSGPPTQLFYKGELVTSPYCLASTMNNFFIQKVKDLQKRIPPCKNNPLKHLQQAMSTRSCTLKFEHVHPDEVLEIVKNLRNSKAAGLDDFDTRTLKLIIHDILPALTHVINLSVDTLTFPKSWKLAKIIPLLKKGDPLNPQNYRPVALLSVLSKVLERVVFKQIVKYIDKNSLLHPSHHGSRAGHSTSTAIIEMYDKWVESIENGNMAGVMMIDLSAAFDLVDHPLLLQKLELLGFDQSAVVWMWSYLTGRSQCVYVDGKFSEFLAVSVGVPQGSVLGALLYILFVNDLPEVVHGHDPDQGHVYNMYCAKCGGLCCYVDDSTFTCTSPDPAELTGSLSAQYQRLADYMGDNKLVINDDKTHLVVMGASRFNEQRKQVTINTGTVVVTPVATEKLLGIHVHQSLKWKEHVISNKKSMIKTLTSRLNALRMISVNACFKTRLMVANSCFMSILTYMISVWGGTEKYIVRAVQVVQNKAARCVTKQSWFTPTRTLLLQCNWLSIEQLIVFHTALQMWRIWTNKCPHYLHSKLQVSRTRSAAHGNLHVPAVSSAVASKSFMVRAPVIWNQIPPDIRKCEKLENFKKKLKHWVRTNIEIS